MRAYTIGNRKSYDETLATQPRVEKIGARPDEGYEGGWVWRTADDAFAFLGADMTLDFGQGPRECAVYELLLPNGWDRDVSPRAAYDGVHRLLTDSQIIGRVDPLEQE